MNKILITGGAGFVGSHAAEYFAEQGAEVTVLDNLSRAETLPTADRDPATHRYNWDHLEKIDGVALHQGDICDAKTVENLAEDVDAIIHTAAQVAVTSSLRDPRLDFEVNALGTFNVLEAARQATSDPKVLVTSTNKVYGENVNGIPVEPDGDRYVVTDEAFTNGIPESLSIDTTKHTPYGSSKLAADLYAQDYAHTYGLRTGVFRMSCIYGTRQFGNEDQGWVAHFILSTLRDQPLTIYGDGRQVRDLLYVEDLVSAMESYLGGGPDHGVWNMGGGPGNTLSLLELLDLLEELTGTRTDIAFGEWREGDQRVYISDIRAAKADLSWEPSVSPKAGASRFLDWAEASIGLALS